MLERIIENWLDNTSERSFQQPYCYILSTEGHTIIHSTRHSAMEMGKDIITIGPDGTPCAFQLKSGNISLAKWRNEVASQTSDLVNLRVTHPSVDSSMHHRSYLVTNGRIEEEVSRAIDDRNRTWASQGQSYLHLKTIVRGELLAKAKELGTDLWPSELNDIKTLLEMFLESGKGILPKAKLASLLEASFSLDSKNAPSQNYCRRMIASTGLLCAIAISSFSNQNNHVAETETWILYIAYVLALAEKWNLTPEIYDNEFEIATQSIYYSLSNLCNEIKEREYLVEGDPLTDSYIHSIRVTWLLGLMSIYALWRCRDEIDKDEIDDFLREFCKEKQQELELWGEAAIPQFLAFFWCFRKINATRKPVDLLHRLISTICELNHPRVQAPLASPYYEAEELLPHLFAPILGLPEEPLEDTFTCKSHALEGLVHLFVRRNWHQTMKLLWPNVTRLAFVSFEPENLWDFYRWRNKEGTVKIVFPKHKQEWEKLKALSFESEGSCIPPTIKNDPILLLLFLCVYPHRMNAEIIRWLDTQMQEIPWP